MWWILLPVFLVLMAVTGWFAWQRRSVPQAEEHYFHFRCPNCERKLRNRTSRIGHRVKCPFCKHLFILNAPPPGELVE